MKKILLIFGIFLISIFLIGTPQAAEQNKDTVQVQDTTKTKIVIVKNVVKMSSSQKREMEYKEWIQRSQKIDKNFETLDKQNAMMDSLLGKKKIDTVRVIK
jgi:hypothetical protein